MNRSFTWLAAAMVGGWVLGGCDRPAAPIRTPDGKIVTVLNVQANDPEEVEAVKSAETARADYRYRLSVLKDYYFRMGNMEKLTAAEKEMKNLDDAQYFRFLGVEVTQAPGRTVAGADEGIVVEEALAARHAWMAALTRLAAIYRAKGKSLEARVIENVQQRFDPVYRYGYFMEAEMPGPELRPTDVIPDADRMYDRAMRLYKEGKGPLGTFVTTNYDKERQALVLLRDMIQKHPTSTKIALAAFYIAEIYKEYFNENIRAVKWYERAWQWDSHIPEAARFQAAAIYDRRLSDPRKALELYRASLQEDPWRMGNREYAQQRINALSEKK
jgi:hypothetical protein